MSSEKYLVKCLNTIVTSLDLRDYQDILKYEPCDL